MLFCAVIGSEQSGNSQPPSPQIPFSFTIYPNYYILTTPPTAHIVDLYTNWFLNSKRFKIQWLIWKFRVHRCSRNIRREDISHCASEKLGKRESRITDGICHSPFTDSRIPCDGLNQPWRNNKLLYYGNALRGNEIRLEDSGDF